MNILRRLFDHEYKELKKFSAIADKIEELSDEYHNLKDEELKIIYHILRNLLKKIFLYYLKI